MVEIEIDEDTHASIAPVPPLAFQNRFGNDLFTSLNQKLYR